MTQDDVHTLTGAYALDALDDVERAAFERHLAGCAACGEEVATLRETAARLGAGVAASPPAALRARVLAEVRTTPQLPPRTRSQAGDLPGDTGAGGVAGGRPRRHPPGTRDGRRPWLVAAAVAALFGLAGTGFGALQWQQARRAELVAQQIADIVGDPSARTVSGDVAGGGSVRLVVAGERAVLTTANLRALPADRTYQLWVVRPDGIRSAGLGPAAAEGAGAWLRSLDGLRPGDTVAVSVEPTGGSEQPTTTPIVAVEV